MNKDKSSEKQKVLLPPTAKELQKTFGKSAVNTVKVEMQLEESVSMFLSAMDQGQAKVSKCKVAFGD